MINDFVISGECTGRDDAEYIIGVLKKMNFKRYSGVRLIFTSVADAAFFVELRKYIISTSNLLFMVVADLSDSDDRMRILSNMHLAVPEHDAFVNFKTFDMIYYKYKCIIEKVDDTWKLTTDILHELNKDCVNVSHSNLINILNGFYRKRFVLRRRVSRRVGGYQYMWMSPFKEKE